MNLGYSLHAAGEGVRIAIDSIRSNKVRAGLTILGIAVGVFVVTVMSAAVHGINTGVSSSLAAAGPTTFYVTKWPAQVNACTGSDDSCPWRRNAPLSVEEAEMLGRLPEIQHVTTHVSTSMAIKYQGRDLSGVALDGFSPAWVDVTAGDLIAGRNFTPLENEQAAPVVVINKKAADRLFEETDPLGKFVSIDNKPFRVIGVFEPLGSIFESGGSGRIYVPFETARRRLNVGIEWMDLTVKPRSGVPQDIAIDDVTAALRISRGLRPAQDNTFFVTTQEKILELYDQIVGVFFLVMLVLGSIGLMVGGVGVIAIMMISVTERTREIGVRKALGATKGTIMWQFLVEAATLTTIGAMAGLVAGGGLTWIIRTATPIAAAIPPLAIIIALAASAGTGIIFGLLPAFRAAQLDPVEALRYE
jgi:putative ABC transport system permease protein